MTFGKANHPDQTFSKCRKRKITHLLENPLQSQVGKVLKTPASLYKNFTPQKWSFVGENSTFSAACLFPKLANVQRVKAIEVGSPARGFPFSEELGPAVHTV